jgi:hypothetical protein
MVEKTLQRVCKEGKSQGMNQKAKQWERAKQVWGVKEGDETQFTTKIEGKTSLGPSYFVL